MPNGIKYSTGITPDGCLRKGDMLISNNTADTGTSFFTGINAPESAFSSAFTRAFCYGYTIYVNKASGGPSMYCPATDTQLIDITNNNIAGTVSSPAGFTTLAQCFNYYAGQSDKLCVNFNYEGIVTDGLVLNLDAGFLPSYPTTASTWYDLSGNTNNGTLTNGPTFNSDNSGSIVFDGTNDYVQVTSPFGDIDWSSRAWSFSAWMKLDALGDRGLVNLNSSNSSHYIVTNVFYSDGKSYWYFIKNSVPTQTNFTQTTGNFSINEIFHFTMTYNGSGLSNGNINFYKNGTLLTTTGGGGAGVANESGLQIGGRYYPLDGNIYNFIMYNRVLSQTEVTQNYNAQKSRFGL